MSEPGAPQEGASEESGSQNGAREKGAPGERAPEKEAPEKEAQGHRPALLHGGRASSLPEDGVPPPRKPPKATFVVIQILAACFAFPVWWLAFLFSLTIFEDLGDGFRGPLATLIAGGVPLAGMGLLARALWKRGARPAAILIYIQFAIALLLVGLCAGIR